MSKYDVVVTRSGDWWVIEVVSGLPENMLGVTQARRLGEVPDRAQSVVSDLLDIDRDNVEVTIEIDLPVELQGAVDLYREADVVEEDARSAAAAARSRAATTLTQANLTMREAGELLGVSHQRIKQLVDRAVHTEGDTHGSDERRTALQHVARLRDGSALDLAKLEPARRPQTGTEA
jgi:hypothetical protein